MPEMRYIVGMTVNTEQFQVQAENNTLFNAAF